MSLPCGICYRIEPNTKLALVIPGRRIPETMTLWLDFNGVMELLNPILQGAINMPKQPDAVWGVKFSVLRMRHEDEPKMYSPEEMAKMAGEAAVEESKESAPAGPKIDA